jgi:NAD(P)-dependent dehydrogenase (short-subunit alcohol dehydrogenase family)
VLTIIAPLGSLAQAIGRIVADSQDFAVPTAIVDALPGSRSAPLGALRDADFETGCIAPLADLAEALARLLPDHRRIVLIGSSAGLGDWDAAIPAAFAAGATGLMRSAALEYAGKGVSINMIALPSDDPACAESAAALAAGLLASGAVSGQVIVCDGGANLRMRAARPRPGGALPAAS